MAAWFLDARRSLTTTSLVGARPIVSVRPVKLKIASGSDGGGADLSELDGRASANLAPPATAVAAGSVRTRNTTPLSRPSPMSTCPLILRSVTCLPATHE